MRAKDPRAARKATRRCPPELRHAPKCTLRRNSDVYSFRDATCSYEACSAIIRAITVKISEVSSEARFAKLSNPHFITKTDQGSLRYWIRIDSRAALTALPRRISLVSDSILATTFLRYPGLDWAALMSLSKPSSSTSFRWRGGSLPREAVFKYLSLAVIDFLVNRRVFRPTQGTQA